MDVNRVILSGVVDSPIDIHYIDYHNPIVRFKLQSREQIGVGESSFEQCFWHSIVAYHNVAIDLEQSIVEGDHIQVQGRIIYHKATDRNGITQVVTEIKISTFELLSKKQNYHIDKKESDTTDSDWIFDITNYKVDEDEPII